MGRIEQSDGQEMVTDATGTAIVMLPAGMVDPSAPNSE